jgi:hypothetical protein
MNPILAQHSECFELQHVAEAAAGRTHKTKRCSAHKRCPFFYPTVYYLCYLREIQQTGARRIGYTDSEVASVVACMQGMHA